MDGFVQFEADNALLQWDCAPIENSIRQRFQDGLSRAEALLQEKISIDKSAAKFLRLVMVRSDPRITEKGVLRLLQVSDFVLEEKNLPEETFVTPPDDYAKSVKKWGQWQEYYKDWKVSQESELIPRDTLSVSKEVAPFIRSCVKFIYTLPKPTPLSDTSPSSSYTISSPIVNHDDICEMPIENFFKMPELLQVEKESDEAHISETLEFEEAQETFTLTTSPLLTTLMTMAHQFTIRLEEVDETTTDDYSLGYQKWHQCAEDIDYKELQSLEEYFIDESIGKGAEYYLDAPFMSDEPTFQEYRTPFEYVIARLPPMIKFESTTSNDFLSLVKRLNEGDFLKEEISTNEQFEIICPGFQTAETIISSDVYWIEQRTPTYTYMTIPTEQDHKEPRLPTRVNTSAPSLTYMQDTAIHVNDTARTTLEMSNTTTVNEDQSSIAATRMATQIEVLPDRALPKRSIDDELETLISLKKQKKKAPRIESTRTQPILDLLRASNNSLAEATVFGGANTSATTPQTNDAKIKSFRNPRMDCARTIGFNSSHTRKFQKHISYLSNKTEINMIELDMDPLDAEFLISSQCAVMIIDISLLDQCIPGGDLLIQEKLVRNMRHFDHLIVLLLTGYVTKRETVAAFQLTLAILGSETIVVHKGYEDICHWICEIAYKKGEEWSPEKTLLLEHDDHVFLMECGLDPFTSVEVLQHMSLVQFVALSDRERLNLPYLTQFQSGAMNRILNQTWIIEPIPGNASCDF